MIFFINTRFEIFVIIVWFFFTDLILPVLLVWEIFDKVSWKGEGLGRSHPVGKKYSYNVEWHWDDLHLLLFTSQNRRDYDFLRAVPQGHPLSSLLGNSVRPSVRPFVRSFVRLFVHSFSFILPFIINSSGTHLFSHSCVNSEIVDFFSRNLKTHETCGKRYYKNTSCW